MRHLPLRRLLGIVPLVALAAGCAEPSAPPIARAASLPPGELIILGAEPHASAEGFGLYLLGPATGALSAWELQGGRGITERGATCLTIDDQRRWDPGRRELLLSGSLGCAPGLYRIAASGAVTQADLPALPAGVEYPTQLISAPAGDALAVVGTRAGQPGPPSALLLVAEAGAEWATFGEGMGFEQIQHLRWSPDGRALAFVAGTRPGGVYRRDVYLADLELDELYTLSEDEALIGSVPSFSADGALVFGGAGAGGASPAIYRAEPGAPALPVVDLSGMAGADRWDGALVLSPDGRLAAVAGARDNPATPWTIYLAELDSGALRDLLPAGWADERSGAPPDEAPTIDPLAWSPDSRQLLAVADHAGVCAEVPAVGLVNCTVQLYTLPAAGGAPRPLGDTQFDGVGFALWVDE